MFKASATNPFDDLVVKATNEDLVSEDWDTNLQICDKVSDQGEEGAKNVMAALIKRLSHRNPNVQIFALELANSLAQNCPPTLHRELSSRAGTSAMDRLITDRTTLPQVKGKAVGYVKEWRGVVGEEGVLGELVESLKARKINIEEPVKAKPREDEATRRAREEEEDLRKAIELSKQDAGPAPITNANPTATHSTNSNPAPAPSHSNSLPKPFPAQSPAPAPLPTRATASRVRAIYPFVTHEQGELSFEKGDVIKVIDRMYDEWYTGAVGGRIGIFPISYVEPLPEPTTEELRQEAQEEAKVFAAQGMIVNLQRMLDGLDPMRGDRVDSAELEEMYQKVVELQPQIVGLMKKYADQRAELEHIHLGFVKASRQYAVLTQRPQAAVGYGYPGQDPYAGQPQPQAHRQSSYGSAYSAQPVDPAQQAAAEQHAAAWAAYYAQQQALAQQQFAATGQQPQPGGHAPQQGAEGQPHQGQQQPGQQQPEGQTQAERDHIAAWQAYYAAQAQMQAAQAAGGGGYGQPGQSSQPQLGQGAPAGSQSPQPPAQQQSHPGYGSPGQPQQQQAQPQSQQQYPEHQPQQPQRSQTAGSELPNPYAGPTGAYPQPSHGQQHAPQAPPSHGQTPYDPGAAQSSAYPNVQPYSQQAPQHSQSPQPPQPQHSPTLSQRAAPSGQPQQAHSGYPAQPQPGSQFPNPQPYHNPYAQGHNPQAISSQSSLGSYAQPGAPPHGGSMPGLERAVSNMSLTGQPQPSGSDPIRFT